MASGRRSSLAFINAANSTSCSQSPCVALTEIAEGGLCELTLVVAQRRGSQHLVEQLGTGKQIHVHVLTAATFSCVDVRHVANRACQPAT